MIKVSAILVSIAVAGLLSWQVAANRPTNDCSLNVTVPGERQVLQRIDCASSLNWIQWIAGKSRSPQFHFLDLLELLLGNKSDKPNSQSAGQSFSSSKLLGGSIFR